MTKPHESNAGSVLDSLLFVAIVLATLNCWALPSNSVHIFNQSESSTLFVAKSLSEEYDFDIGDEVIKLRNATNTTASVAADAGGGATQAKLDPAVDPQYSARNEPALPLILTAPWSLGSVFGVRLTMAVAFGTLAVSTRRFSSTRFGVNTYHSVIISAAFFTSLPLIGFGHQITSAVYASLLTLAALYTLTAEQCASIRAGVAIAALTLFSITYLPVAFVLGIWLVLCTGTRLKKALIASALLTFWAAQIVLRPTPISQMLAFDTALFQQQILGLISWLPVLLLAPAVAIWYYKSNQPHRWGLISVTAAATLTALALPAAHSQAPMASDAVLIAVAALIVMFALCAQHSAGAAIVIKVLVLASAVLAFATLRTARRLGSNIESTLSFDPAVVLPILKRWHLLMAGDTQVPIALVLAGVVTVTSVGAVVLANRQRSANEDGKQFDKFGNRSQSLVTLDDELGSDLEDIIEP